MVDNRARSIRRPMGARAGTTTTSLRGEAGRARLEQELEQQAAKKAQHMGGRDPFRFRMAPGETKEIIICDSEPNFFRYEHNMMDPVTKKWSIFTGCTKENDNCPICEATGRESYYAMYLTVIDFTPFTTKSGEKIEFSRKLLVVKTNQQKKFIRKFRNDGTLRGALFEMNRDGDKDSSIGNDIEFIEYVKEEELATYSRQWSDKDGKIHTENCDEPYDYDKIFPPQSTEELRRIVGAPPTPGSRAHSREALEEENQDDDNWEDTATQDTVWEEGDASETDKPATPARRMLRGTDAEANQEANKSEAPAPRVGRRIPR